MRLSGVVDVDYYGMTDVGRRRETNQDQFLVAELHKVIEIAFTSLPRHQQQKLDSGARALMILVADGVGGTLGGEEASSVALDTIVEYVTNSMRCFYKLDHEVQQELMSELARIVTESDERVRSEGTRTAQPRMATTLTMAHVLWPRAYVVQIGDSRCYHLRGESMAQITKDQTIAEHMIEQGIMTREHAAQSPFSNVLSQAIGAGSDQVEAEISTVDLEPGDSLLLCTDGLTKHVPDDRIADRLRKDDATAESVCRTLVRDALEGGGTDNVTVTVARFSG